MSRRNHKNNGNRDEYVWWPDPPMRRAYRRRSCEPHWESTEVHRAFMSFGADNRTGRLSDEEFGSQVVEEIGYLFSKSGAYFRRGMGTLWDLLNELL